MESSHQGENIYVNEMVKKAKHFLYPGLYKSVPNGSISLLDIRMLDRGL